MQSSPANHRPCFEALESRLLLDGNVLVWVAEGHLYITGDAADNAVVLTGLEGGGYEISGMPCGGAPTTINGGSAVNVSNIALRIVADLGGGDDVLNVGAHDGRDTTVVNILEYHGGDGTNQLNIGRIDHSGLLYYAGRVTMGPTVSFDNQTFGVGNVLITGAEIGGLDAHLGYGEGDRSVAIADLWYGLTYHPPSDIGDIRALLATSLTISNPLGELDAVIHDTSASMVNISTSGGNDHLDFQGVHFLETSLATYDGSDTIMFGASEYRDNSIDGLTVETGRDNDTVFMSDTVVGLHTDIDMGPGVSGTTQRLHISPHGGCELTNLTVRGTGVATEFNSIAGVNETVVHGTLDIQTGSGRAEDDVVMYNVRVLGETSVELRGGADSVIIHECRFGGSASFDLSEGDDIFLVGQQYSSLLSGDDTWVRDNLLVEMGDGSDQVGISKTEVEGLLLVQLGASAGRGQRARIATLGGTVHAGVLGVTGSGKTNVYIGNTLTAEPSVMVDGILSISTGMDVSRDVVSVQNVRVIGEIGISTGGGTDVVVLQRSQFTGPFTTHLGDGVDFLSIWDCDFYSEAEFYGDRAPDLMWILDSRFFEATLFDGGHGRDWINRSWRTRNEFFDTGVAVDIEREF